MKDTLTLRTVLITAVVCASCCSQAADAPEPKRIEPGSAGGPPSDAIVLFDGKDLSQWKGENGAIPKGPLVLQDHGNPVRYRNIWMRPLDTE